MIYLVTTIHILVCLFIIIVVLLQSGQSGDITAAFGGQGSQTAFGPRGAASALSKATTWSRDRVHADLHHAGGLLQQAERPHVGAAGREIATGQDPASTSACSCRTSNPAEIAAMTVGFYRAADTIVRR